MQDNPQTRKSRVRTAYISRILRRRNYGLIKIIDEYADAVYSTVFNKTQILDEAKTLYQESNPKRPKTEEGLDELYADLNKKIAPLLNKIRDFYKRIFKLGSSKVMNNKGQVLTFKEPTYEQELDALVNNNLQYVQNITEEQRKIILDEIAKGIKQGLSFQKIGENIIKRIEDFTINRAVLIANTETLRAHSYAQEKTMRDNGITKYQWISANDNRTAPLDKSLHGHIFEFGNTSTMEWRDTKGKTHEISKSPMPVRDTHPRCRCVIVAITE